MEDFDKKILKVKSKKRISFILSSLIIFVVFASKFKYFNDNIFKSNLLLTMGGIIMYLCVCFCIFQLIWIVLGETIFIVSDGILEVKSGIPYLKYTKTYSIDKISNVRITTETDSSTFLGIKFTFARNVGGLILPATQIQVISFDYQGKKRTLGLDLEPFDLTELSRWIKK